MQPAVFILLLVLIFIVVATYYSYRLAWYYFVNYILNGKIFEIFSKEFLIIVGVFFVAFVLFIYFSVRGPKYFEQGVDQLHKSDYVRSKIGSFSSYTFRSDQLPKKPIDSAAFQIELDANDTLYLTCVMKKIGDNWKLVKIQQDSIHKNSF